MPQDNQNMIDWNHLYAELSRPFPDALIKYRVGAISKDKAKAQALAFAPVRIYEDRLNELVPGAWSVEFEPWGDDRIVCRLTIHGATRSSTGDGAGSPEQISGTVAEAQAFKRACSKFGLGRHLYDLPIRWVPYDPARKSLAATTTAPYAGESRQGHEREWKRSTTPKAAPIDAIGSKRAAAMQRELAQLGLPRSTHGRLAHKALGRHVARFSTLTLKEARRVWHHAQKRSTTASAA